MAIFLGFLILYNTTLSVQVRCSLYYTLHLMHFSTARLLRIIYSHHLPSQLFRVIIASYEQFINHLCISYTLNILAASS